MLKSKVTLPKEIKISNVVTTADLKQKINIKKLNDYPWGIYDQVSYHGICGYVKTPDMNGRVTIFATGKMISIGSNSFQDSIDKLNQAKFYLSKQNLITDVKLEPIVRNTICTINLDFPLNLKKLTKILTNSIYEPEKFVGLRYKIREGLTALLFSSGKIVLAGGKSTQEISQTYYFIRKTLDELKKYDLFQK